MPPIEDLLSWPVAAYIIAVVGGQVILALIRRRKAEATAARRKRAGLGERVLVDHGVTLGTIRRQATVDALVLLGTIVIVPIILAAVSDQAPALAVTFLALSIWALVSATDVARSFLGGAAFRAYVGLRQPFQVGDRVTLMGHSGKVDSIDPFFVRLVTLDDDLVSIPAAALWGAPIVSVNAGDRASLVTLTFHLAPFVTAAQRKDAEDAIWDTIQRSVYWDFDKPIQIYLQQRREEIVLTARAYVASTYNEPLFRSDVYNGFLDFADDSGVPLASTEWRREVNLPTPNSAAVSDSEDPKPD